MKGRLGEILVANKKLDPEYLEFALQVQKTSELQLGEVLVTNNLASEKDVYEAIAEQYECQFLDKIDPEDIDLPHNLEDGTQLMAALKVLKQQLVLPLKGNRIAMCFPPNARRYHLMFGSRNIVVSQPTVILTAIEAIFLKNYETSMRDMHSQFEDSKVAETIEPFVDAIIRKALISRASDIHFEIEYPSCYVRYRIDGDLIPQLSYDIRLHNYIANIILMRSLGNPANNKRFDDASFEFKTSATTKASFRVSKVPTEYGAAIVLRILRQDAMLIDLAKLGFLENQITLLRRLLKKPYGIILMAGPTGSGKSTSLYSLVNELRGKDTKVLSVEDPIEINIPFVEQVQVNIPAGVTFDTAIRAFLRHDPDVILIGEIRDSETAKMAVEASMTGHLVLSSIHANSVFDVFTRLLDLGVSYRKMTSVIGIIGQRLVKKICGECSGKGCTRCNNSGYHGRAVVSEMLEFTEELKDHLYREDMVGLLDAIKKTGFMPINEVAKKYVELGITTKAEAEKWVTID